MSSCARIVLKLISLQRLGLIGQPLAGKLEIGAHPLATMFGLPKLTTNKKGGSATLKTKLKKQPLGHMWLKRLGLGGVQNKLADVLNGKLNTTFVQPVIMLERKPFTNSSMIQSLGNKKSSINICAEARKREQGSLAARPMLTGSQTESSLMIGQPT